MYLICKRLNCHRNNFLLVINCTTNKSMKTLTHSFQYPLIVLLLPSLLYYILTNTTQSAHNPLSNQFPGGSFICCCTLLNININLKTLRLLNIYSRGRHPFCLSFPHKVEQPQQHDRNFLRLLCSRETDAA